MAETIRGKGTLIDIGKIENLKYAVEFKFDGTDSMSGLPPALTREEPSYSGQVWRLDGVALEKGPYELHAADGVKYRVENRGTHWAVIGLVSLTQ